MALIKCPECGKENVSDTATSCPSCGYNILKHMELQRKSSIVSKSKGDTQSSSVDKNLIDGESPKTQKTKWYFVILLLVIVLLFIFICSIIKQKQKQEEIASAKKSFDKLNNVVCELFDAKYCTWNIYDDVKLDVADLKKYVEEINEIYSNYDLETCHEIDDYIEEKTLIGSWHDYTIMLNNEYYLFNDEKEAITKIIDYVPSSKSEASFEIRLSNFDKVKVGMTQNEVITLLGKPTEVDTSEGDMKYCYGNSMAVWFGADSLVYKFADDL